MAIWVWVLAIVDKPNLGSLDFTMYDPNPGMCLVFASLLLEIV